MFSEGNLRGKWSEVGTGSGVRWYLRVGVFAGQVSEVAQDLALHVVLQRGEPAAGLLVHRVMQLQQLHKLLPLDLIGHRGRTCPVKLLMLPVRQCLALLCTVFLLCCKIFFDFIGTWQNRQKSFGVPSITRWRRRGRRAEAASLPNKTSPPAWRNNRF